MLSRLFSSQIQNNITQNTRKKINSIPDETKTETLKNHYIGPKETFK